MTLSNAQGFFNLPGGEVTHCRVNNLALAHQVFQTAQGLFEGGNVIKVVDVVNVNIISIEAFEAGFNGKAQVAA